jgi:bifunctional UDP-N-acetylglucosamine pyrophosphorylase / glucosamine-1-phosphate N-acetyltransferase
MRKLLIIPAAGQGSRLSKNIPKALYPVNGLPMYAHLVQRYRPFVDRIVLIAAPSFAGDLMWWAGRFSDIEIAVQQKPTGMLDAILLASTAVAQFDPESVWITWCDQVGVLPETLTRLTAAIERDPMPVLVLPTVRGRDPYIHFPRDATNRIVDVLHRREGDEMPEEGESDMGLFALSRNAFDQLPDYAKEAPIGRHTRERNFLPFIPWLAHRGDVVTIPCTDPMEARGINTPQDLRDVEAWLRANGAPQP